MDAFRNAIRRDTAAMVGSVAQPRFATVESVDASTHSVRLTLQPEGVLTGWVPDASAFATGGGYGMVFPLSVGDQVKVVHANGDADNPVIVGRLFSTVDMPPVSQATGKPVQSGEFGVFTDGAWLHMSGGVIYAQATKLVFTGDVDVTGNMTITGTLTVSGIIKSLTDVLAMAISLLRHLHGGVKSGGNLTSTPQ